MAKLKPAQRRPETGQISACGDSETVRRLRRAKQRKGRLSLKLIAPMLTRFMASDRAFAKARRIT